MPPAPHQPSKPPPTSDEIDQQLIKLRKDPLMQGGLRRHVLRWLIDFKVDGNYSRKPKPFAKDVFVQFYEWAKTDIGIDMPEDTESAGKKLFGELADALEGYYAGPGAIDSIVITLQRGRGGGYEPHIEWKSPADQNRVQIPTGETVETFSALPREQIVKQIENSKCQLVRICITSIINFPKWELFKALSGGARAELLFSHPEGRFIQLRGEALRRTALRSGVPIPFEPSEVVQDNIEQLRTIFERLQIPDELKREKLAVKLTCELMPISYIQVDDSIHFSPFWNGGVAFEGLSFGAQAGSVAGKFLDGQFTKLWDYAQPVDLSKPGFPPCEDDPFVS
jgi:hypothetical protein